MPAQYEYQVVPFLAEVKKGSAHAASEVAAQLQKVINEKITGGWEFYRIDHVYVYQKPGCLGRLLFQSGSVSTLTVEQIVFRRGKE